MRLGNPILAAQCKVFAAMSLIQRGRLKMASKVIRCVTAGLRPWVYQWFISKPYCINKISIWIVAFCIAFFCSLGWTRVGCLCYFFHQLPPNITQILLMLWLIGNRTFCRPIRSLIILVYVKILLHHLNLFFYLICMHTVYTHGYSMYNCTLLDLLLRS